MMQMNFRFAQTFRLKLRQLVKNWGEILFSRVKIRVAKFRAVGVAHGFADGARLFLPIVETAPLRVQIEQRAGAPARLEMIGDGENYMLFLKSVLLQAIGGALERITHEPRQVPSQFGDQSGLFS